jgi:hypothetical protein
LSLSLSKVSSGGVAGEMGREKSLMVSAREPSARCMKHACEAAQFETSPRSRSRFDQSSRMITPRCLANMIPAHQSPHNLSSPIYHSPLSNHMTQTQNPPAALPLSYFPVISQPVLIHNQQLANSNLHPHLQSPSPISKGASAIFFFGETI